MMSVNHSHLPVRLPTYLRLKPHREEIEWNLSVAPGPSDILLHSADSILKVQCVFHGQSPLAMTLSGGFVFRWLLQVSPSDDELIILVLHTLEKRKGIEKYPF